MLRPDFHYPVQWIDRWSLPDGAAITVRPVLPQDAALEHDFYTHQLSSRSRYQRFMVSMRELPGSAARYFTDIDYHAHFALIAETWDAQGSHLVGDARFVRVDGAPEAADFALAIADGWQGRGLGGRLLQALVAAAQAHGLRDLHGDVFRDNTAMLQLARSNGFTPGRHPDDPRLLRVSRTLAALPTVAPQPALTPTPANVHAWTSRQPQQSANAY